MSKSENFERVEKPKKTPAAIKPKDRWGADVIADRLHRYKLPYAALNPRASYRGLHDSVVNYCGNMPKMMLCEHEETAVQMVTRANIAVWLRNASMCMSGTVTTFIETAMSKSPTPINRRLRRRPSAMSGRWAM